MRLSPADLPRGDHERSVLDRTGAQERLPVRATRYGCECRRNRERGGAAQSEDAEELGEAQVVTDREPKLELAGAGGCDVLSRALVLGLPVFGSLDLDVEHVELAVGGRDLAVRADQHRRVEGLAAVAGILGNA